MIYKRILTNPKWHKKDNFIYLVHAIISNPGPSMGGEIHDGFLAGKISRIFDKDSFYRVSLVGVVPEEKAKRVFDHGEDIEKVHMLGDFGLLVNPAHNGLIYVASPNDLASANDPKILRDEALHNKGKIATPLELLTKSPDSNSELIIRGNRKSRITGVFHDGFYDSGGYADRTAELVKKIAGENVPVVEI